MKVEIVFENQDFLVINKPFDVVVNRAESISGETIQDWVESRSQFADVRSQINDKEFLARSGVCHRLDKDTSGCLVIAKNPRTMKYFLSLFKERKIHKTYTALVHGRVDPKKGDVILPLKRSIIEREKWRVHYEGKKAITLWEVEKYFDFKSENENWKDSLSLLSIDLKTGRTHQIRVHMSFLGWPLFADSKYLNKKQLVEDDKYLTHHFLHARRISFKDEAGVDHDIVAPMPEDCSQFLTTLKEAE